MTHYADVIIIGGGLAGLASAIHLSKMGLQVAVIEKYGYPRHKVCGEYISNEIMPYLEWLNVDISTLNASQINRFQFSSGSGSSVNAQLPLGGFGISRYALDQFLYNKALANGCICIEATVTYVHCQDNVFTVKTKDETYTGKVVLGAYGKRSNIDSYLSRSFIQQKSPWLAVKAHYSGTFPNDLVALHNFNGGYCGVSKVENDTINICYLADYTTFKKYKNIEDYQQQVLYKNRHLKAIFEESTLLFDKHLTISQICFDKKAPVEKDILMVGDSAGLIHPLCGNGMAMALHSSKLASDLIVDYHKGKITSKKDLNAAYTQQWNSHFSKRLFMGRMLGKALRNKTLTSQMLKVAVRFPSVLPQIIKRTHGKPVNI